MAGARRPGDVLVYQGAPEIVAAGLEELAGTGAAHLDPGRLDMVVEDLRRRPRQRAEAGVGQPLEIDGQRLSQSPGALDHFQGGEAVHVDARGRLLHRPADLDVEVTVEGWVDPTLEAHLGGA